MICRLCLKDLNEETAISLFRIDEIDTETELAKIIAMHFHLELLEDDPISTYICEECCAHLDDFHNFWVYIDQKQSDLREEFLEMKDDSLCNSEEDEEFLGVEKYEQEVLIAMGDEAEFIPEELDNVDSLLLNKLLEDDDPLQNVKGNSNQTQATTQDSKAIEVQTKEGDMSDDEPQENLPTENLLQTKPDIEINRGGPEESDDDPEETEANNPQISKKKGTNYKEKYKSKEEIVASFMTLKCDLCQSHVDSFSELSKHFHLSHKTTPYVKCCDTKYASISKLVTHINWHQNAENFKCNICDKTYRFLKSLEKHKLKHESEQNVCNFCSRSFPRLYNLRRHIDVVHKNIFPHVCDTCGKKFRNKQTFDRHILEHKGIVEPPVQCADCGEWFKNKRMLRMHRYKHEEGEIKCKYCGRICPSRRALEGHVSYMHKRERNLKCKYCEKTFKLPTSLEEHLAVHTGAQLYSCPHCPKEFRSKANKYVHVKRCHVEEWVKSKKARSYDPKFKLET